MAKDGYWKIHDDSGSTMKVGVDLSAIVSADVSSDKVNFEESTDPHGGGCDGVGNAPKPASFFVYWDQGAKKYDVFDPTVITPDGNITATLPESFDTGEEYSCCVEKDPDTGEFSAEIMLSEYAEEQEDAVMSVPLFVINEDGTVDQKHLGTIIVNKGGVTSLKGDDEESVKIDGDIEIDGGKSGLTVKTELEEQDGDAPPKAKVTIDVKGREDAEGCSNTDNWGCQEIKLPGGGIGHFLGCHPIDLSNVMTKSGGGGGGGDPDDPDNPPDDPDNPQDDPDNPEKDVIDGTTYVRTIHGETEDSDTVSGDLDFKCAEGSGLVVKTAAARQPTDKDPNTGGAVTFDLEGREALEGCNGSFGLHELKFRDKDGNVQIFHGLLCGDVDLTKMGKTIKSTNVVASSDPGGQNKIVFNYSDGSSDTFIVMNGLDGGGGGGGGGGGVSAPDIEVEQNGGHTYIYIDGELVADIPSGKTPVISASKSGKVTTIYSDDVPIASISDGKDAESETLETVDVITGITFSRRQDQLVANVHKSRISARIIGDLGDEEVVVSSFERLDVVTSESYNADGENAFKNERKKITVFEADEADGQSVFTTTPHSSEGR